MATQGALDVPHDFKKWKPAVLAFARQHPGIHENKTIATWRFLESHGHLPSDVADKLCMLEQRHLIPAPETVSRILRGLEREGLLRTSHHQRALHEQLDTEVRDAVAH